MTTPFASNIINIPTSVALTPNQKRIHLFNVEQPLELSMKEFDEEWWPLVSNVWAGYSSKNNVNCDSWKVFICRFNKHNKSSTRKGGVPYEKRRITKIWPADLCSVKIKVQRYIFEQKVRIERFKDSPDHTHSLEESEKIKRSQAIRDLVVQEVLKNYRPPEIINAIKEYATVELDLGESVKELKLKEVINIKYKVRRSLDVHLISNSK